MRTHVRSLLDRHSTVLGSYRWTEFDDEFLTKNVESVSVADLTGPKVITDFCCHPCTFCFIFHILNFGMSNASVLRSFYMLFF